jgi:signal transduction histidine kinase
MVADRIPWWRRFTTVRARTTAAATAMVGTALAVAAVTLVVLLHRSLVTHVDEVAEVRAEDVAALARQGSLPTTLAVAGDNAGIAQVVDDAGRVVATSPGLQAGEPIARFRPRGRESETRTLDDLPVVGGGDDEFRVVALRAASSDGPVTVYVASNLEPVEETIGTLRRALVAGTRALLVLVGLTTWVVVGRALRPVEAIRAQVADISDRSLDRRVPVPATHDEISRLAATMNTMLDRLQGAAERQRRFVADASHELQTPLASARTDLEVSLAHPERADWARTAADLLAANRRMERLVRDLLFLAQADDGVAASPATPVDLDDVVLSEAARLRSGGRVTVDTSRVSGAAVLGRRDELARAVRNLLDNAERHASAVVTLELTSDDRDVTLVVADDGPGIPAADRARVFERFTRLDGARARHRGGSGLGLAIVREIVDAHGGTVTVQDAPVGARLVVRLRPV